MRHSGNAVAVVQVVLLLTTLGLERRCAGASEAPRRLGAEGEAAGDAFLGDEMPLKVRAVIPVSSMEKARATRLSGRTALTVVFSRAVIALGADWSDKGNNGTLPQELVPFTLEACKGAPDFAVPGKIRWVTTSIARFDADMDWPSDLCFDLKINARLRSFDGLAVTNATGHGWRFETRTMRMSISSVTSAKADKLTDGMWASTLPSDKDTDAHEVPPDAVVYLSFTSDIDHAMAFASIQVANMDLLKDKGEKAYEKCGRRCLGVRPRGLEAGKKYKLIFPEKGVYLQVAGAAHQSSAVTLKGIMPFVFPFYFKTPGENHKLRYRRHRLLLRHGLSEEKTEEEHLEALGKAMTLTDSSKKRLKFTLSRPKKAVLLLESPDLQPSQRYSLQVTGSKDILDGFGQQLQPCGMEYLTEELPTILADAGQAQSVVRFREFNKSWRFLTRGKEHKWYSCPEDEGSQVALGGKKTRCGDAELNMWPVHKNNLRKALATFSRSQGKSDLPDGDRVSLKLPSSSQLEVVGFKDLPPPDGHGGLFLREIREDENSYQRSMVSVAHFGAAFIATNAAEMIAWVTDFATGAGVEGATVSIYKISSPYRAKESDVSVVASGKTDANGTAVLKPDLGNMWPSPFSGDRRLVAAVEHPSGELAFSEDVPEPVTHDGDGDGELRPVAILLTDRAIYRPGDAVYVKGYVRMPNKDGTGYIHVKDVAASLKKMKKTLAMEVQWKRSSSRGRRRGQEHEEGGLQRVDMSMVEAFGTVSAMLTVPKSDDEVTYGRVELRMVYGSFEGDEKIIETASITVADPRPPTVTLNMSTHDEVVLPGVAAALNVRVHTGTYTGIGIEGAEVKLSWRLRRKADGGGGLRPLDDGPEEYVDARTVRKESSSKGGSRGARAPMFFPMQQQVQQQGSGPSEDSKGEITVSTGADGVGELRLNLHSLLQDAGADGGPAPEAAEGDRLEVSARWVGPTREVVEAELDGGEVKVARSPYVLGITPSRPVSLRRGMPLPGIPFSVLVDLRGKDGESLTDTSVNVSLHEWDGEAIVVEDPVIPRDVEEGDVLDAVTDSGLKPVDSWGKQVASCKAAADGGKAEQCEEALTLPEAKKYVVLARARDPNGVELVTAFAVGKTPQEWQKFPLASLDEVVDVRTDKSHYAVDDTAELSFMAPFQDMSAMWIWGNGAGRRMMQTSLSGPPGKKHSIKVPMGKECSFGCYVLLLLAAPSQEEKVVLPVTVPTSPLLDVTLPRAIRKTVRLSVPDTMRTFEAGSVEAAVTKEGEAAAGVLEPGENATIRVKVPKADAGSEVCVFVVDKAMLDVGGRANPHPVTDVSGAFVISRGESFDSRETFSGLASAAGYEAVAGVALERAAVDPWAAPSQWPVLPDVSSQSWVEQTDEDYFSNFVDDATYFPPSWGGEPPMFMQTSASNNLMMPMMAKMAPMPMMRGGVGGGMAMDMEDDEMELDEAAPMEAAASVAAAEPPTTSMAMAKKAPSDGGAGGSAPQLDQAAFTRSNFETTPLFAASVVVDEEGVAFVPLHLPDNIATFEVRAYVVDGNSEHRFGHATTSVTVRRAVSLMPSIPRVVRPGDRFECGITVTGHEDDGTGKLGLPKSGVRVQADVAGGNTSLALREGDLKSMGASKAGEAGAEVMMERGETQGPQEIVFPFQVPTAKNGGGLGTSTLKFTASIGETGKVVDGLEAKLPVKPPQSAVMVATSFALSGTPSGAASAPQRAKEGLSLPDAMPGSGALNLTAGVGYLPFVLVDARSLLDRKLRDGQTIVAALVPSAALRVYGSVGDDVGTKAAAVYDKALGLLPQYTDNGGYPPLGLMYRPEDKDLFRHYLRASVDLNANALLVTVLLRTLGGHAAATSPVPLLSVPETLTAGWQRALELELNRQVRSSNCCGCSKDCYQAYDTIALVRAALGYKWEPSEKLTKSELSMDRLFSEEALKRLSPRGLALAALAYTLHTPDRKPMKEGEKRVQVIYDKLQALMRVQGRTAYISSSVGSQYSAGLESNSAVLLALASANKTDNLVSKVAQYVASGGSSAGSARFGGGQWMGAREAAMSAAALAMYDVATESTQPDLTLTAASGDVEVLKYEVEEASVPPKEVSTAWEELGRPPSPVEFQVTGHGQVSIAAMLTFVPASVPTEGSIYRGLFVEKVIRRMDAAGNPTGPPLQIIQLGQSVVVTIQVTTPDDLSRVMLKDLTAGGLEPVDPNVAGDYKGSAADGSCSGWWIWWCMPAFYHRETFSDRVEYASWSPLRAGTHTVTYQAVAATRGIFTLPPAYAYVDDQPELMGLSQTGTIVVADEKKAVPNPSDVESVEAFLKQVGVDPCKPVKPKGCPGGCPNGGVCQLSTGKCGCYQGLDFIDGDCPINSTKTVASELFELPIADRAKGAPSLTMVAMVTGALVIAAMFAWWHKSSNGKLHTPIGWHKSSNGKLYTPIGRAGSSANSNMQETEMALLGASCA